MTDRPSWESCYSEQRGPFYRRYIAPFTLEVFQPAGGTTWACHAANYTNGGFLTELDAMNHAEATLLRRAQRELRLWGDVKAALEEA